ncbi:MAG: hypothetical protein FJX76_19785 [Armatimonadetes bacterium]|nr:hypothetical protein [Armatimonadota bacterium]
MKLTLALRFVAVALLLGLAAMPALAGPDKTLPDGSHLVTLSVPDVECQICQRTVNAELKKVSGVQEVRFDDLNRLVSVKYDAARTDPKKIQQAIKRAGFSSHFVDPH